MLSSYFSYLLHPLVSCSSWHTFLSFWLLFSLSCSLCSNSHQLHSIFPRFSASYKSRLLFGGPITVWHQIHIKTNFCLKLHHQYKILSCIILQDRKDRNIGSYGLNQRFFFHWRNEPLHWKKGASWSNGMNEWIKKMGPNQTGNSFQGSWYSLHPIYNQSIR